MGFKMINRINKEVIKWFTIAIKRGEFALARKILQSKRTADTDNNVWRRCKNMQIETHLVDHCNLKCASCFHFSPICDKWEISIEELRTYLKPFDGIADTLQLLGGEPLLHSKINDCLKVSRECLPNCRIQILTNGILLPQMPDDFFTCCKDYHIAIRISEYPVDFDYGKVIADIKDKGVDIAPCDYMPLKNEFFLRPFDPKGGYDPKKSYGRCYACPHIRDGKLFPCPDMAMIDALNKRFGTDFQWVPGEDYIGIDEIKDKLDILKFLMHPKPFCKYCGVAEDVKNSIPWHPSNKTADEWIIN